VRPRPIADAAPEPGAHRVFEHIAAGGVQVLLAFDYPRAEPVREEVPEAHVLRVEGLGVPAQQAVHPARELRLRRVQDEVEVRRHQAQRVHAPAEALDAGAEPGEEEASVLVVAENGAAAHATRHDVEVAVRQQ
jgi:hypothetical protein